jgi:hypothetical protein
MKFVANMQEFHAGIDTKRVFTISLLIDLWYQEIKRENLDITGDDWQKTSLSCLVFSKQIAFYSSTYL